MANKNEKIYCNRCGAINKVSIDENGKVIDGGMCVNCKNELNIKVCETKGKIKTTDRIIYELENAVLNDENCSYILQTCKKYEIDNTLTKYLTNKYDRNFDFSFINDECDHYDLIIKDLLSSNYYSNDEKNQIINNLKVKNKDLYLQMLDESIYKTENSRHMIEKMYQLDIEIVKSMPEKSLNINYLLLFVGIISVVVIFLIGLFFKKDLGEPLVIILSIIPALLIGVSITKLAKMPKICKIFSAIVLVLSIFIIVSYLEILRFDGFVSIKQHFSNIISSCPNFVDAIFSRLEYNEEILEEINETGFRIR